MSVGCFDSLVDESVNWAKEQTNESENKFFELVKQQKNKKFNNDRAVDG